MPRSAMHRLAAACVFLFVGSASAGDRPVRVLVWDEQQPEQRQAYGGKFLGETIAAHLSRQPGLKVAEANLESPEQGLDAAGLDAFDVVVWWSHKKNAAVSDERAERLASRVRAGKLALIALHSAHWAKPFVKLMQDRARADALAALPEAARASAKWEFVNENPQGRIPKAGGPPTPRVEKRGDVLRLYLPLCVFPAWRADGKPSHVATLLPEHPVAAGLPPRWNVPQTEMYSEPFHVPEPDAVVFEETWDRGERFRSGCVWKVGEGRVFYFRPGHETYPVFQQAEPLRVLTNAVFWLGTPEEAPPSPTKP